MWHPLCHMANTAYKPDLINALRETIRKLQADGYDEAHLQELQKNLVLILAKLESSESEPMAAD
jgi:hypothetical protein